MKLLTVEMMKRIPPLYSQERNPDPIIQAKFFTPDSNWTWYILEGSGVAAIDGGEKNFTLHEMLKSKYIASRVEDVIFFGIIDGFEKEFGYFALGDLENAKGPLGLKIERDKYWRPKAISKI